VSRGMRRPKHDRSFRRLRAARAGRGCAVTWPVTPPDGAGEMSGLWAGAVRQVGAGAPSLVLRRLQSSAGSWTECVNVCILVPHATHPV
jgi:hypothetical protein